MCTVINHVLSKYLLRKYSGYDLYRIKYLRRKNLDPEVFLVSCIDLFECHRVFSELSGSEVMSSHLRHEKWQASWWYAQQTWGYIYI